MLAGAWTIMHNQSKREAIATLSPRAVARWFLCCLLAVSAAMVQPEAAATVPAAAACGAREAGDTRPRIGLALGGGGARGIAHVSVVKKIEELRIPVDCI